MVRFEENKLVIEITTLTPAETWLGLHGAICDVARNVKRDNIVDDNFYLVIDFIQELMPEWELAKKITDK